MESFLFRRAFEIIQNSIVMSELGFIKYMKQQ